MMPRSTKRLAAAVVLVLLSSPRRARSFLLFPSKPSGVANKVGVFPRRIAFCSSSQLQVLPSSFHYGDGSSSNSPRGSSSSSSSFTNNSTDFQTALAIVPPLPDWDKLQRARHFARDKLFHKFPPAIRLFHPFHKGSTTALDVAQVVEELDLEPFTITLDTWVIVPHLEAVEAAWVASESAPAVFEDDDDSIEYEYYDSQREEDAEIRRQIEVEERIGLQKAKARKERTIRANAIKAREKAMRKKEGKTIISEDGTIDDDDEEESLIMKEEDDEEQSSSSSNTRNSVDPSRMFEEQQQQYEEFGGPCILCLEPNAESKQMLQDLRQELALLLDQNSHYSSPSSIYSWKYIMEPMFQPDDYRPLIPIASFQSLQPALEVARRLKGVWGDPLTFEVNELHLLSCRDDYAEDEERADSADVSPRYNFSPESVNEWFEQSPWGCNAKIMLMGQEQTHCMTEDSDDACDYDEDLIAQQIKLLFAEGQAGGNDISSDYTILDDEEEINASDIEMWLDNDEDWDEGMQVVIGRTHFYTGEQRNYRGMPASSVVDSKDRSMGDLGGSRVSGLARRRRTSTRKINQWENGEYGRRESDYLPWSKKERPKKVERLLQDFSDRTRKKKEDDEDVETW
jgi:hypothetical protein